MFDSRQHNVHWFVDVRNGSDSYDGTTPDNAYATIAQAITQMNARIDWTATPWASRNVLHIAPGLYAENITSLPYGAVIQGYGSHWDLNGEIGVVIKPASGSPVDCTSIINCIIDNIAFFSPDTSVIFQVDNFNRNTMTNCLFAGLPGASPTTTKGFEVVKDCTGSRLENITFLQVRNGIYVVTDNANSKQISGTVFENIKIMGADQTGFYFDINCNPAMVNINNCVVGSKGTALALGLDDNTDQVTVTNTMFNATANDPATGSNYYNNCYLNGALLA